MGLGIHQSQQNDGVFRIDNNLDDVNSGNHLRVPISNLWLTVSQSRSLAK